MTRRHAQQKTVTQGSQTLQRVPATEEAEFWGGHTGPRGGPRSESFSHTRRIQQGCYPGEKGGGENHELRFLIF